MRWLRQNLGFVVFLLGMLAARSAIADHYVVPSGSMEPAFFPGDRVAVDKRAYGVRLPFTLTHLTVGNAPARGDVVVFDAPDDGTRLIKRIVAVGGDVITVHDGHVSIDGRELDAAPAPKLTSGGGPDVRDVRVPEGHVFVMGDFRGNSRDSRYFGFVRADRIYARALGIYWRTGEGLTWRAPG